MSRPRSLQYQQQPPQCQPSSQLEKSVGRLQSSLNTLHNTITMLNASTTDLPRIKHVIEFNRQYEIVTDTDIREAQAQIASDVQPQITMLLAEAEDMLNRLEREEKALESKVEQQEIALEDVRGSSVDYTAPPAATVAKSAASKAAGAENAKKLKRLRMRRQALVRTIEDRDEEVSRKENELRRLESQKAQQRERPRPPNPPAPPATTTTLSPAARQQALQRELAEVEAQVQKRKNKLQTVRRSSISEREARRPQGRQEDDPIRTPTKRDREVGGAMASGKVDNESQWQKYPSQLAVLLHIASRFRDRSFSAPRGVLEDLEVETRLYLQQIQRDQDMVTATTLPDRRTWKLQATAQMRAVCKVLFPENNVGITMGRVLEILMAGPQQPGEVVTNQDEVDLERGVGVKVFAREFPPSQERRHNLQRAIQMLGEFGIAETVMEVAEGTDGADGQGEMMVRIKGVERVLV